MQEITELIVHPIIHTSNTSRTHQNSKMKTLQPWILIVQVTQYFFFFYVYLFVFGVTDMRDTGRYICIKEKRKNACHGGYIQRYYPALIYLTTFS